MSRRQLPSIGSEKSAAFGRCVWSALTSRQNRFSVGGSLAKRFDPEISPFAASVDNSCQALQDLSDLICGGGDHVYLLQIEDISLPDTLEAEFSTLGVVMIETRPFAPRKPDTGIERLSARDTAEMVALADLTKPGPFTRRTPEAGTFWGIRQQGRLAAMAGTRLDMNGSIEISGICTHPDFQGRGLARALTVHVASEIRAKGDTPFLHAFADNHKAIALYRKLGFEIFSEVNVAKVRQRGQGTDP